MKIKNTRELVLRAQGHARLDHIKQGTYGKSSCNGAVEFQGCAIGCLATPHRTSELRSFIRKLGRFSYFSENYSLNEGAEPQLHRLTKEFGITQALARCAEAIFEGLETHGEAINFIPAFAKALPEGVNITPQKVRAGWRKADPDGSIEKIEWWLADDDYSVTLGGDPELVRDRFLDWLGSLA